MTKKKIVSIVGVRPNFVKLKALSAILSEHEHIIVHTGQHYDFDLSRAFFQCLELPNPQYNLEVGSGTHGYQLGEMIKRLEKVLIKEKPNFVIVYGDCNSTLAGALAATRLHIKMAHVEAGYRSYDKTMPEETNRLLTDQISDLLFAPTKTAVTNLKKENIQGIVYLTGDIMVDVLIRYKDIAERESKILTQLGVDPKNYILVTVHREDNTKKKEKLANIVEALKKITEYKLVFPIHPRTKNALQEMGLYNKIRSNENLIIIPPLNYLDFVKLEKNAAKIITDSGGVQKEAYILGIPCITLRNTTEVIETVREGWNVLVDADIPKILNAVKCFDPKRKGFRKALGDGDAAIKIAKIITDLP
ncbi:MAG: UDP-N-acetylglucosamine 2-epimerase (non-hydrolyzing) [Candidatus Bathyarchaeia archaeon]